MKYEVDLYDFENRAVPRGKYRPDIQCRFRLSDAELGNAHQVVGVVRLDKNERFLASSDTLMSNRDLTSSARAVTRRGAPIVQRVHVHEVGHGSTRRSD